MQADAQNELWERDQADMARLATGHESALNDLMERHAQKLFHYLVRNLHDENEADDLTQEVFMRVYQNRAKFNTNQKFSSWLYAIATNLAKDRHRYWSRHPQVSLDAQDRALGKTFGEGMPEHKPTPSELLEGTERSEAVRQAVGELPAAFRVPLMLSEYQELSHKEIGAVLHCTPKTVENRIYRARKQLREKLGWLMSKA